VFCAGPNEPPDWNLIAAWRRLDLDGDVQLSAPDIQDIATAVLEADPDHPEWIEVLIPRDPRRQELQPLLDAALAQNGVVLPDHDEAAAIYALHRYDCVQRGELPGNRSMDDLWYLIGNSQDPRLAPVLELMNKLEYEGIDLTPPESPLLSVWRRLARLWTRRNPA
jgi:hypothetical protein